MQIQANSRGDRGRAATARDKANFSGVCCWVVTEHRSNENRQRYRDCQTHGFADDVAEQTSEDSHLRSTDTTQDPISSLFSKSFLTPKEGGTIIALSKALILPIKNL